MQALRCPVVVSASSAFLVLSWTETNTFHSCEVTPISTRKDALHLARSCSYIYSLSSFPHSVYFNASLPQYFGHACERYKHCTQSHGVVCKIGKILLPCRYACHQPSCAKCTIHACKQVVMPAHIRRSCGDTKKR
jgi:hypothetical protein